MKKITLFVCICFLGPLGQTFAQTTNVAKQTFWTYLSKMRTYTASFEQTSRDAKGRLIQKSQGTMALSRPGRLKWETLKPTHQQLFVNNNIVWVYDVDLEQASKNILSADTNNPGTLLSSSVANMKRQFTVNSVKVQRNLTCFILHQKQASTDEVASEITMCFKGSVLQSMALTQGFSGQTQFVFSNIRLNQTIPQSVFRFKLPAGVEVIDKSKL